MSLVHARSLTCAKAATRPRRAVVQQRTVRAAVPRPCLQRQQHAARIVLVSAADSEAAAGAGAAEGQMNAALMEAMQVRHQAAGGGVAGSSMLCIAAARSQHLEMLLELCVTSLGKSAM